MRRAPVHAAFASVTLVLAAALLWQLVDLRRVERDNRAVEAVPATLESAPASDTSPASSPADEGSPRVRLARAVALSAGGASEAAEVLFTELARRGDEIGRAARFDLANAYLRRGLEAAGDPARARGLVELAKQRYRDLLRETPDDWNARYNLERALRVAPEGEDRAELDRIPPVKSVDVVFPGFEAEDLP